MIAAALLLAAASPQAGIGADVTDAKARILQSADKIFLDTWPGQQSNAAAAGITATQMRATARWLAIGTSIGFCDDYPSPGIMADWYSNFDTIPLGYGEGAAAFRSEMQKVGNDSIAAGAKHSKPKNGDPARIREFCRIEMIAIRELMAGR